MKQLGARFTAAIGVSALLACASFATSRAAAPAAGAAQPAKPHAANSASGQAAGREFRKVGTGAVITPEPGAAAKKYKDCTYNDKGAVTNAPCTGVKKDDKGVTWWP